MNNNYETLQKEIEVATKWWADFLQDLPELQVTTFQQTLKSSLLDKYSEHWDVHNSAKGSAFRAISADFYRIDPILIEACKAAKIDLKDFTRFVFRRGADHVMFINPGEVKIRNCALLTTSSTVIWSLHPVKSNTPITSSSHTPTNHSHSHSHTPHESMSKVGTPTHGQLRVNGGYYLPPTPHHGQFTPHNIKTSASVGSDVGQMHGDHHSKLGRPSYYLAQPSYHHPQLSSRGMSHAATTHSNHRPSINAPPFSPPTDSDFENRTRTPRK